MKRRTLQLTILTALITFLSVSCSVAETFTDDVPQDDISLKINLSGEISQVYQTRANDSGFCDGDEVGIYVVDYNGTTAGELLDEGNRGDNVRHTFDEANFKWNGAYELYFKDSKVKMQVGLCKGKKIYDKRADMAAKSAKRDMERALKERQR